MSKHTIAHCSLARLAQIWVSQVLLGGASLSAADTEYASLDQLPAPVQVTLKQVTRGAVLSKFEKVEANGVIICTAEIPGAKPETVLEFTVSPVGKLLKTATEDTSEVSALTAAVITLGNLTVYRTLGVETLLLIEKRISSRRRNEPVIWSPPGTRPRARCGRKMTQTGSSWIRPSTRRWLRSELKSLLLMPAPRH